ncbi:MAG: hypothetical protein A2538_00265 [Candidatus Magasanikbacteria bacterium RIFOXYD2_FULL_41_14]|uniref:Transcriptional repressor n=1 Tax=Candidatus Magasanikbacteria bacterium RIFOXYD2_FULL_41_14 TaxID=1798709 RepID=A0A1F6PEK7_9BACT|nr:MAG: hypothetical protein A2538_00265 [Candidatus Magasanikbacteria bacterium RIFOXYD2_FULL_41_14]
MPTKKIYQILKDREERLTPRRRAIIETLSKNGPWSVDLILPELKKRGLPANKTTVYRELNFLNNLGLINELHLPGRKKYYEIQTEHHHHLICSKCKKIKQLKLPAILCKMLADVTYINNCTITNHHLEFSGLCNRCNK